MIFLARKLKKGIQNVFISTSLNKEVEFRIICVFRSAIFEFHNFVNFTLKIDIKVYEFYLF